MLPMSNHLGKHLQESKTPADWVQAVDARERGQKVQHQLRGTGTSSVKISFLGS